MTKLGQHFLKNKQVLEKIAGLLDSSTESAVRPGGEKSDAVVEVGPGHGELTEEIKNRAPGIEITAIEKDEQLAEKLREKFSGDKNIKIVSGDALKELGPIASNLKSYRLIGNIPYYITGKLLRTIGELPKKPETCVLTMQKEVAERLVAGPPKMNRLAASVQFWAEPKIAFVISRNSFQPPPEVDSATIILKPLPRKTPAGAYYGIVRAVFSQPRKTVLNSFAGGMKISKAEAAEILKLAEIDENSRPQNVSVENILKLTDIFQSR